MNLATNILETTFCMAAFVIIYFAAKIYKKWYNSPRQRDIRFEKKLRKDIFIQVTLDGSFSQGYYRHIENIDYVCNLNSIRLKSDNVN